MKIFIYRNFLNSRVIKLLRPACQKEFFCSSLFHVDCDFRLEFRTTLDGKQPTINMERSEWHDGYFIAVCKKTG